MPSQSKVAGKTLAIVACALSAAAVGCARREAHAAVPAAAPSVATATMTRPMTTAPDTTASPPVETVVAPPAPPAAAAPDTVGPSAARPPAPRRAAGAPAATETASEPAAHPAAPQIAPQLSAGDQASLERKTTDDIAVAERNLQQASGRQLSAAQQDLVAKISSFLGQSRDASKDGDWARAQNLAQKARLLSVELLNSL